MGKAATTVSTQRKTDPRRLGQLFRGELDWIVMKCLEKDRNRRYETASALAADVQHYLNDEPVLACPPSAWYRFRKFARRKKTALVIAACVLLALAGITGGIGWAVRDRAAQEEWIEAERRAQEEALDQTVETILNDTGPLIDQGKWPEALAAVERADKLLEAAGRTDRPTRMLELRKELTMAEHLDEIYRGSIVIVSTRPETKPGVQAPRRWSFEDEPVWGRGQDAGFAKAFRDFEIDVDALLPTDAAAQITRRSTRAALIRALDGWAAVRRRDRGQNDPGWKKLVEIACQADPDPWRNRCRETMLRDDRQALEQLADAVPIRQLPPATLCLLGMTLKEVGALDKAMGLLRRAQQQYPDDLWLNHTLGYFSCNAFQPPRLDDALRFYTVVSALRPRFAPIHLILGNTLMNKGAPDDAMTEYTKAIELDPKNATYWQQRGWNYLWKLRDYDKARLDSSEAIRLYPKFSQALCDRAVAYRELHQYDKCLGDLDKIIGLEPEHRAIVPDVYNNTAWYLAAASEPKERDGRQAAALAQLAVKTVALAQLAVTEMPTNANCWNTLGAARYRAGSWKEAIAALVKSMDLRKGGDSFVWFFLAMAHWQLGEKEKARPWFDRAVAWMDEHQPRNEQLLRFRSEAAELLAVKDARDYLARSHFNLAEMLVQKKQPREAIKEYRTAIAGWEKLAADFRDKPEFRGHLAWTYNHLAAALIASKQPDEAEKAYRDASALLVKLVEEFNQEGHRGALAYNSDLLGHLSKEKGRFSQAASAFRQAMTVWQKLHADFRKDDYRKYQSLSQGWLFEALVAQTRQIENDVTLADGNRRDKAQACRTEATELAQDGLRRGLQTPTSLNNTAWRLATDANPANRDPALAIALAKLAVEREPKQGMWWKTLGAAQYRARDWKVAVEALSKSMELRTGGDSFDWFFLAMAHWKLGEKEKAHKWFDRAVAWMDEHQPRNEQLLRFRSEAAELLAVKDGKK
jgi:tetratricopeptide (TPR) repeat protein